MRIQGFDRDKDEFAFSQSARSFIGMYSFLILFIPISKARDLYVKNIRMLYHIEICCLKHIDRYFSGLSN